jgi:predicted DNA binding CopG/RHH family protein
MKRHHLDREEQEILDAIESGKWELIRPKKTELLRYAEIAKNTLRKDQRMNIRISRTDLARIKAKAAEEGVPYQTLVAGLIHKYVSGSLKEAA